MSHELAMTVFAIVPCAAAIAFGRPAALLVAAAFALAAAGEEGSLWHASWILGEGWLGRSVGAVSGALFALPAIALGLGIRARRADARRRAL